MAVCGLWAAVLGWAPFPARGESREEKAVRDSLVKMVTAIESQDMETLKGAIATAFLDGNPEIPGRVQDAFEKYAKTKITYKIASITVADEIATVRLNWTRTATDPLNNWTYRDIGNNVVMQFSAVEPYQLIGLQEPNLFGISFLLKTRIVFTAPAMAKLELQRKALEIEEQKLKLEKDKADAIRKKEEEKEAAKEAKRKAKEEAEKAAQAEKERLAKEKEAQALAKKKEAEEKAKADTQAKAREPSSAETPPAIAALAPATVAPIVLEPAPTESRPALTPEQQAELEKQIRAKADAEAKKLVYKTQAREAGVASSVSSPTTTTPPPPDLLPEVEAWRQAKLKEIREAAQGIPSAAAYPTPEKAPPVESPAPSPPPALTELAKQAQARAQALPSGASVPAPTPATRTPAAPASTSRAPEPAPAPTAPLTPPAGDLTRVEAAEAPVAQPPASPAAVPPVAALPDLRALESDPELVSEVSAKANADAAKLLQAKPPPPETVAAATPAAPVAAPPDATTVRLQQEAAARAQKLMDAAARPSAADVRTATPPPESPEALAMKADVRAKAQADAVRILAQKTGVSTDSEVEVIVHEDTNYTVEPATEEPVAPAVAPALSEQAETPPAAPPLRKVPGGKQPGGPAYEFFMAQYEVTTEEFCRFLNDARAHPLTPRGANVYFDEEGNAYMDATLNRQKRLFAVSALDFGGAQTGIAFQDGRYVPYKDREKHPVTGVSWFGALKYCNWLTLAVGLRDTDRCYSEGTEPDQWHPATLTDAEWVDGFSDTERQVWVDKRKGFRLPMNNYNSTVGKFNEFYAASAWKGSENTVYGFGRSQIAGEDANFMDSGDPLDNGTTPVGYYDGSVRDGWYRTNPNHNIYEIHDLSGNVWEWSNDTTGALPYRALYGGSWANDVDSLKNSYRGSLNAYVACDNVGFRVIGARPPLAPTP